MVLSQPLGQAQRRRQEACRFNDGILDEFREDWRSQWPESSTLAGLRSESRHGPGNRARGQTAADSPLRPLSCVRAQPQQPAEIDIEVGPGAGPDSAEMNAGNKRN